MEDQQQTEPVSEAPSASALQPTPVAATAGSVPEEYAIAGREVLSHLERETLHDDDFPPRPIPPPPMSRWMFLCTVYRFPFRREVSWRWCLLSTGLTPAMVLIAGLVDRVGFRSPLFPFLAAVPLALPLFFLALWTAAYGAALFNNVFEATAGGGETIETWPDADWTDWLGQLAHLIYVALLAAFPSVLAWHGITLAMVSSAEAVAGPDGGLWWLPWAAAAAIWFVAFPIAWVSTAFSSSSWLPLSSVAWLSLVPGRAASAWLLFFAAALPLPVILITQLAYAPASYLALAMAGFGPQLAAAWLIYARLLGRLAWEIGESAAETDAAENAAPEDAIGDDPVDSCGVPSHDAPPHPETPL